MVLRPLAGELLACFCSCGTRECRPIQTDATACGSLTQPGGRRAMLAVAAKGRGGDRRDDLVAIGAGTAVIGVATRVFSRCDRRAA